jgi:6-pyruvoyltetrahydropterin/6-carboxytetrahydropterin synthase
MYEVVVETSFTAAHRHGPGLHGHDFRVLLSVQSPQLADDVVVDFHALQQAAGEILARLGHTRLDENRHLESGGTGPANLARWIYEQLAPLVPRLPGAPGRRLSRVEVWDTPVSGGSYSPVSSTKLAHS